VTRAELLSDRRFAEFSPAVAGRVAAARERAAARLHGTPWRLNAEIPGSELRRSFPPAPGSLAPLERAMDLGQISVVGTRAATGYGAHVCGELAIALAEAGWTIVSGGALETADTQQRSPTHASGADSRRSASSACLSSPARLQHALRGKRAADPSTRAREARNV
jgi:hypothetical protein